MLATGAPNLLDLKVRPQDAQLEQKPKELVTLLLQRSQDGVPVGTRQLPSGYKLGNLHGPELDEHLMPLDEHAVLVAEK